MTNDVWKRNTSSGFNLNILVMRVDCERLRSSAFRRKADGKEASLAQTHLDRIYGMPG